MNNAIRTINKLKSLFLFTGIILLLIILTYPRIMSFNRPAARMKDSIGVLFRDPDTCYHARRILFIAQNNMKLPFYDPMIAYPQGAVPIWSPLYDWISALPSFILGAGSPGDRLIIVTAQCMALLFGIIEILFLVLLAYKLTRKLHLAILAGFLTGMTNSQIRYTSMEILDHNSMLLALFAWLLYLNAAILNNNNGNISFRNRLIMGFGMALLFWTWPGSYIYIAVLVGSQLLYTIMARKFGLLIPLAHAYLFSAIMISPLAFIHRMFNKELFRFEYVSFFTGAFLLAVAAGFYALSLILKMKEFRNKNAALVKLALTVIVLCILIAASTNPLMEGYKYSQVQNGWLTTVLESKPLFYFSNGPLKVFTIDQATINLTYLVFIFPVAFLLIALKRISVPLELYTILIVSGLILGFLAISQLRYTTEFSIPLGLACALLIDWSYRKVPQSYSLYAQISLPMLIVILIYPSLKEFKSDASSPYYLFAPGFQWLKSEAKEPPLAINTHLSLENSGSIRGAIAPWSFGNHLMLYSGVPVVADNLVIYMTANPWQGFYDSARFFLTEDEQEAVNILKKYKCTYVIVTESSIFGSYPQLINEDPQKYFNYKIDNSKGRAELLSGPKELFFRTIAFRLSEIYGSANPSNNPSMMNFNALQHFRLIYELPSPTADSRQTFYPSLLKIYQYVPGAELEIPISSTQAYRVEALIESNTHNLFYYRQNGNLSNKIIVPYSTEQVNNYSYAKYYKVFIGDSIYEFTNVPESEIIK